MLNPWLNLSSEKPFILPSDRELVFSFNEIASQNYRIHEELLPEPFLGNPKSNIFLLNLNPGYSEEDPIFHRDLFFFENSRKNLAHFIGPEYPFFLLNPLLSACPGHRWWKNKLKILIEKFGLKKVANGICCVEYFPYHSKKFKPLKKILDSQKYGFNLVKEAISRHALIVIMRKEKGWLEAIPELKNYPYFKLKNKLNPCISPNNLPIGFQKILEILASDSIY